MGNERTPGAPTTRRYSPEEKARGASDPDVSQWLDGSGPVGSTVHVAGPNRLDPGWGLAGEAARPSYSRPSPP